MATHVQDEPAAPSDQPKHEDFEDTRSPFQVPPEDNASTANHLLPDSAVPMHERHQHEDSGTVRRSFKARPQENSGSNTFATASTRIVWRQTGFVVEGAEPASEVTETAAEQNTGEYNQNHAEYLTKQHMTSPMSPANHVAATNTVDAATVDEPEASHDNAPTLGSPHDLSIAKANGSRAMDRQQEQPGTSSEMHTGAAPPSITPANVPRDETEGEVEHEAEDKQAEAQARVAKAEAKRGSLQAKTRAKAAKSKEESQAAIATKAEIKKAASEAKKAKAQVEARAMAEKAKENASKAKVAVQAMADAKAAKAETKKAEARAKLQKKAKLKAMAKAWKEAARKGSKPSPAHHDIVKNAVAAYMEQIKSAGAGAEDKAPVFRTG